MNKASTHLPIGLLQSFEIPGKRWETVTMDLITQLPVTTQANDAIVVFVDKFSKMVHYAATTTTCTADQVARTFFDTVVRLHGLPKHIISDRDSRFTSKFWQELWKLCGTQLKMSTAYHPQTDGQTERANRTLEEILRHYVSNKQDDWDHHLTAAEIAVNSSVQASTGFTPYYLNYGDHPTFPTNILLDDVKNESVYELMQQLQRNIQQAVRNMENARDRQTYYANQHRRDFIFKEGEEVLLSTKNLKLPDGITRKLSHKYNGPFKIVEVISPTVYKLQLPEAWKRKHPVFHASLLKKYTAGQHTDTVDTTVDDIDQDDEVEYEVDKIIGQRITKDKQTEYLVTWKGHPGCEATWETYDNVKDLKAMDDYEEAIKASEASLTRKATTDYIMRKWTKPHVQRYIKSLMPSSDLTINMTTLANIMKRHQVDGEKLIHLSKDILMDMAIPEQAAVWLMEQFEELFNNQSTYPLRV